jgi:hypothetical protein
LAGNTKKFTKAYGRLQRSVAALPPTITWGDPIMERAPLVREAVAAGPDAVRRLLGEWRDESFHRYKLDKPVTQR